MSEAPSLVLEGEELQDQPQDEPEQLELDLPQEEGETEQPEPEPEKPADERQVPLAALHEERSRRRELDQQLAQLREQNARMEERFRAFQERLNTANEPEVRYEDDPAEYLRRENAKLKSQYEELNQARQLTEQERQQQQALMQFQDQLSKDEAEFSSATPDYYDAVEFLKDSRVKELQAAGFPPAVIQQALVNDTIYVARTAAQSGRTPPEAFYQMAKARGFTGKAPTPAAPAARANPLQQVNEGQRRAAGMGASGGDNTGNISLAKLSEMDDEEFEKYTSGGNWRKLWGG